MLRYSRIIALTSAAIAAATPGVAEDAKPFPEFTFKRVKVPKAGTGPRIKVQITPETNADPAPETSTDSNDAAPLAYDWYWAEVSPSLSATAPGRLTKAVLQLDKGPGVPAPRLQTLQQILVDHGASILAATIGKKVSPALILAVMSIESSGQTGAVSSKGATGLMQLMPDTAERFGVTDITNPADNIRGGVAYLDWLMKEFDGDPILVLASYNAGESAVKRFEGVPPYSETRAYVPKVLSAWKVARGLCLTPPELISDGCAFRLQES